MLQSKGIINNLQREIIENFINIKESGKFYLTGGTALSDFFFAHRRSSDEIIRQISVKDIKILFSNLAKEIMDKIKYGGIYDTP